MIVLQLVNDPDNNVYNGDIGYIEDIIISKDKKIINQININYDGNIVEYTLNLLILDMDMQLVFIKHKVVNLIWLLCLLLILLKNASKQTCLYWCY